jgi:phage gp46-like protein
MSSNVIRSAPTVTPNLQGQIGVELKADAKNKAAEQPRMKSHSVKARSELSVGVDQTSTQVAVKEHSAPRTLVKVDQRAVDQALLEGNISLDEINGDRHAAYYKHASMMISGASKDKTFLLRCLAKLYVSVPDETHPKASRAHWLDDQNERWGDDLMFLFENAKQVDELNSAGKQYFLDALQEKANLRYRGKGTEGDLAQSLFQAKHRMPVVEEHSV